MLGLGERNPRVAPHDRYGEDGETANRGCPSRYLPKTECTRPDARCDPEDGEHGVDASEQPPIADTDHAASGGEPAHRHSAHRPLQGDGRGVETNHVGGGYCP